LAAQDQVDSILPGEPLAGRLGQVSPTQKRTDVALIGYQDQGNLGMGYLAAMLREHRWSAEMIDIRDGSERIAARLTSSPPLVVGFSLIFQFFLPQYRRLASYLRDAGITSHFTIGGHYPSLCHEEILQNFPELDSVVRYEGELTLLELVQRLSSGRDWRPTPGLAYLDAGRVVESEARPLIPDLDTLPLPHRPYGPEQIGGFPTLPLLASRGCARRCSFCSIHTFYRTAPGKVVRVRKPQKVVEEMLQLHHDYGTRVFLFQDDDFPLWGRVGRRWAEDLADRMCGNGLAERTIWKISCRAEYVEPELFAMLRDAGLFLVYMGIESGNDAGLQILYKQMTVEQNRKGVEILKQLGLRFSYGFMLFDPSSSFSSVRENIDFLREIVGDGCAGATFCRMLPYGGTPIRDQLARDGRLRGDLTHPDYEFLDPRLNDYYRLLSQTVRPWIHDEGVSYQLNYAGDELETILRLVSAARGAHRYRSALRSLTAASNERLFQLVEQSSIAFEHGDRSHLDPSLVRDECEDILTRLVDMRNAFIADNLDFLTEGTTPDCAGGPVMAPQIH
jgi:anaerobic magnesium-protoporphyrin IX monomethyl ester cyclase